jgi:hypothetical protein
MIMAQSNSSAGFANLTCPAGRRKLNRRRKKGLPAVDLYAVPKLEVSMKNQSFVRPSQRALCVILSTAFASAPLTLAFAQTNAAAMAVRGRVEGLQAGPESPSPGPPTAGPPTQPEYPPGEQQHSSTPAAGTLDTTYVSPNASTLIVLRPAQILTSPNSQLLPTEVLTAAGQQYLGIDPAEIEEVIAFSDISNPLVPGFGVTLKFKNPFRATTIPAQFRPSVQLGELAGKKYLQSSHPLFPSFFGPNNRTLVCAPEALLRPLVESAAQPKNGPLIDRLREVAASNDLYIAVDLAKTRAMVPPGMMQAQAQGIPPEAKQFMDLSNLISSFELTLNLVSPGPVSFVLQANDETAAQQIETMILAAKSKFLAQAQNEPAAASGPFDQQLAQFRDRMAQRIQPQRNGTSITCLRMDAQDPMQRQLIGFVWGVIAASQAKNAATPQSQTPAAGGASPEAPAAINPVPPSDPERR